MIRVPGYPGIAFGIRADGDGRSDASARSSIADALGIAHDWAVVDQVHGGNVVDVRAPGHHGSADAMVTSVSDMPLAIGTADCVPVAIVAPQQVGIAHAGWRGIVKRIVANTIDGFDTPPDTVVIGPRIGPCCFEVGPEVVAQLGEYRARTTWGTTSVDLSEAVKAQLPAGTTVIDIGRCTMCDDAFASYRRDRTTDRQVNLIWR